eukprot:6747601-Ditylum_brightwellii.AAC.1
MMIKSCNAFITEFTMHGMRMYVCFAREAILDFFFSLFFIYKANAPKKKTAIEHGIDAAKGNRGDAKKKNCNRRVGRIIHVDTCIQL